jgi:hypothetical protein
MLSNRLAFAALAVACIGAAAGGGYLASRQNAVPAPTQAATLQAPTLSPANSASSSALPASTAEAIPNEAKNVSTPEAPVPATSATTQPKRIESPSRVASSTQQSSKSSSRTASPPARTADSLPSADRGWPNSGASVPGGPPNSTAQSATQSAEANGSPQTDDRVAQDPPRAPEPPQKTFEELVVVANSVIGLQAETTVTSERARVEDKVEARVTRDVRVRDMVAIPAGSRALGTVVSVERGGKFRDRARLGIRFNTLVLADSTRIPISTDTIYREGEGPAKDSAAKMTGAAVGGAILGAIIGGGKGAAIGGAVGAGAGAGAVMAADRSQATLESGSAFTVRILTPVTVTIEQK